MPTITRRAALAATLATPALALGARAQGGWPDRNMRLIVPFPPGGAADIIGRMLAEHLQRALGRPMIVENRGGAGSSIGVDALAKAAPDGATFGLINIAANAILPAVRRAPLPYDPVADFAPISNLITTPNLLVVNAAKLPAVRTVADLVAHARANPEALNFASSGVGSSLHLAMELFMLRAGIKMVHVPFQGGGPALQALVAGTVDLSVDVAATTLPFIRDGRLRALATTSPARLANLPDVPALVETHPGTDIVSWHGFAAPPRTPAPIIARLASEAQAFLRAPETLERFRAQSLEVATQTTPESFAAFMAAEVEKFRGVARAANIVVDG
jgi:tripartite-type tricarboxylate transporter receptor subunit TctC